MPNRRRFIQGIGASALLSLAGCSGGDGGGGSDETTTEENEETTTTTEETATTTESGPVTVAVGPEKRLRFEPEHVDVSVGDTVVWEFESAGHNVTSHPDASPKCENPEGAEPFTSYEDEQHYAINEVGTTFEHTFEVPGEFVYVCTPHAGQGMVGSVTVTE